jgi:hypothetical protein
MNTDIQKGYFFKKFHASITGNKGKKISAFMLLVIFCTSIALSGCKNDPVPLSREGQTSEYFRQLREIAASRDDSLKIEMEKLKSVEKDIKLDFKKAAPQIAEVFGACVTQMSKANTSILSIKPPRHLTKMHSQMLETSAKAVADCKMIEQTARNNDKEGFFAAIHELNQTSNKSDERLAELFKESGFSSVDDLNRELSTPKKPMAWWLAIVSLMFGGFIGLGILQTVAAFAIVPAIVSVVGASALWEKRKFMGSAFLYLFGYLGLPVTASLIGVALASIAEVFMWPRTQLAPWFVYFLFGWTCLGFFGGTGEGRERREGAALWMALLIPLCTLGGFILTATSKGALPGPWHWVNQTVLHWISRPTN